MFVEVEPRSAARHLPERRMNAVEARLEANREANRDEIDLVFGAPTIIPTLRRYAVSWKAGSGSRKPCRADLSGGVLYQECLARLRWVSAIRAAGRVPAAPRGARADAVVRPARGRPDDRCAACRSGCRLRLQRGGGERGGRRRVAGHLQAARARAVAARLVVEITETGPLNRRGRSFRTASGRPGAASRSTISGRLQRIEQPGGRQS